MKVSVVTATYSRPQYLKRAIESLLSQTHGDLELLIVDDNSPESEMRRSTKHVVDSFIGDDRIKYIQNERNIGGAASRNVGIFAATGDYICFLDDDDMYLPTKVEIQLSEMLEHGWNVSVMDGATYKGDDYLIAVRNQKINNSMTINELIKAHLMYHISGTNTFMYEAGFLKSIGGFDDIPSCQEYILMQKTLDAKPKMGYISKILIKNFMHEGEQISTSPKKIIGQKYMFENKQKYFNLLNREERAYVICRHHGVLFFVFFKNKKYFKALTEAFLCFVSSPIQAVRWFMEYRKKITC